MGSRDGLWEAGRIAALLLALGWTGGIEAPAAGQERARIDLSGTWGFRLDREDAGIAQRWFEQTLPHSIELPGSLQEQGYGDEVSPQTRWVGGIVDRSWYDDPRYAPYRRAGNIKVPFWLQPSRHYVGAAWYQREVAIPPALRGKHIVLHLERPHWETRLWVDGTPAGVRRSLATAHEYDLSDALMPPGEHRLTLRVDNRLIVDVGQNAHSVSDHTQSAWNGIAGALRLIVTDPVWIDEVQVYPRPEKQLARVVVRLGRRGDGAVSARLTLRAAVGGRSLPPHEFEVRCEAGSAVCELDYPLGAQVALWDEFSPQLYELALTLEGSAARGGFRDQVRVSFGMRTLRAQGTEFAINGRKTFLRGTLECCIFPLHGYPPTDVPAWKRIVRICKEHGLNHIRFHSWCPPEAAFRAADELGFYYQVECGAWARIGDGTPLDAWLLAEGERILRAYGNHPSFALMAYGNEPSGKHQREWLRRWVEHWQAFDPRRLYTSASGWPILAQSDFNVVPRPRIQHWGEGLRSIINARAPQTRFDHADFIAAHGDKPTIAHEIGQWCVYPNFDEIPAYTGVLKARNFEIFRDFLAAHHMADQARDFLMASGKLQVLCYKADIEAALRTRGLGGFQLLDLHDFPGQGTALVGVLDPFWNEKPYLRAETFRRFCNQTVPLARMDRRVFTAGESFGADLEVAHFGPRPLRDARIAWRVRTASGREVARGALAPRDIPIGHSGPLAHLQVPLTGFHAARKLNLEVAIEKTTFRNDWDLWVYPADAGEAPPSPRADLRIARALDRTTEQFLRAGGEVLLLIDPARVATDVALGFSTVFWNTAWTRGQAPHTLGILCDPNHPALAGFPTEAHTNWQWWYLLSRAATLEMDGLPAGLRPIVQVIDTWFDARRLGLVFEARLGQGRLLVTSIDLASGLAGNPVARQLRTSLLKYMESERFDPTCEVSAAQIRALSRPPTTLQRLGATIRADSAEPGYEAARAIDGDPATLWHTRWSPAPDPLPHHLVIDLRAPQRVRAITCQPRTDMSNGRIATCALYASLDGEHWGRALAQATWPDDRELKRIQLAHTATARFLKLVALEEVAGRPYTSLAEIDVVLERDRR